MKIPKLKPIPTFKGYFVSEDDYSVWSTRARNNGFKTPQQLTAFHTKSGLLGYNIMTEVGSRKFKTQLHLIALAFHGVSRYKNPRAMKIDKTKSLEPKNIKWTGVKANGTTKNR